MHTPSISGHCSRGYCSIVVPYSEYCMTSINDTFRDFVLECCITVGSTRKGYVHITVTSCLTLFLLKRCRNPFICQSFLSPQSNESTFVAGLHTVSYINLIRFISLSPAHRRHSSIQDSDSDQQFHLRSSMIHIKWVSVIFLATSS